MSVSRSERDAGQGSKMGAFSVTIEVGDPQGQRYEAVEALVDTGATHTVLPSGLIRALQGGRVMVEVHHPHVRVDIAHRGGVCRR